VGSLILISSADLPVVFLAFFEGDGLVAIFRCQHESLRLALAPLEGPLMGSSPGDRAKTGTAGIGMSPLKLRTGEIKLSKACIQTKET
jgi:hypothetical protein